MNFKLFYCRAVPDLGLDGRGAERTPQTRNGNFLIGGRTDGMVFRGGKGWSSGRFSRVVRRLGRCKVALWAEGHLHSRWADSGGGREI